MTARTPRWLETPTHRGMPVFFACSSSHSLEQDVMMLATFVNVEAQQRAVMPTSIWNSATGRDETGRASSRSIR
jgi:hypothetical protein